MTNSKSGLKKISTPVKIVPFLGFTSDGLEEVNGPSPINRADLFVIFFFLTETLAYPDRVV